MIKYYRGIAFIVLQTAALSGVELLITESGNYELGASLISLPAVGPDTIITISANDVTFDLGGQIISQGNATAGIDGIFVMPGMRNVTIQNGTMQSIQGIAMNIAVGCSRVVVQNMVFDRCGISVNAQSCAGFELIGCRFVDCSSLVGNLITIQSSTDVKMIENSVFRGTFNTALIALNGCTAPTIRNVKMYLANGATFFVNGCQQSLIDDILQMGCITENGIQVANGAGNSLSNATVIGQLAGGSMMALATEASSIIYQSAGTNYEPRSAGGAAVFALNGNGIFSDKCVSTNCVTQSAAAIPVARGFFLTGATSNVLISRAIGNRTQLSNLVITTVAGAELNGSLNTICMSDSLFNRNVGRGLGAGVGVFINGAGPARLLLARNVAFRNQPQLGPNQYAGVNPGAVTHVLSTNVNGSLQTPWTNLSVPN